MYIDRQRSWFMHGSVHEQRSEGGIQPGSTVGVLLDLDRHQLSFYVNEEPQVCVKPTLNCRFTLPHVTILSSCTSLRLACHH
jgi:hypothetical protein